MLTDHIKNYYEKEIQVIQSLDYREIEKTVNIVFEAYERQAEIYLFGNGGSAATASHFVNDLNKGVSDSLKKKFHATCLCDNTATIMAIANDLSYDDVFRYQLLGKLKPSDLVIAISGSGNSKNVIKAVEYAREIGAVVIGVSGYDGGKLMQLSDFHLHVPVNNMQIVEDIHMTFCHMLYAVILKCMEAVSK